MMLSNNQIEDPLVSIVIPNYNNEAYLTECLESVLKQNYAKIEVIVIDDGSTDRSNMILQSYKSKVNVIRTEHSGASSARNIGIKHSNGEFIAFMDSDDIWMTDKIQKQMNILLNSDADLVYCGYQEIGLGARTVHPNSKFKGECYEFFKKYPGVSFLACGGVLVRKSTITKAGLFNENFKGAAEDWDFLRRICLNGRVDFSPEVLFYYRRHSNSITGRSPWDYYKGNQRAVLNMFEDDLEIRILEKRTIWFKLHWMFFKSFLLKGKTFEATFMLLQLFLPIPSRQFF